MRLKNIYFILSRPQLGENIGSTARALKNFDIPNLSLVNPRCVWPNQKAIATSVGARTVLNLDLNLDLPAEYLQYGRTRSCASGGDLKPTGPLHSHSWPISG